MVIGLVMVIVR